MLVILEIRPLSEVSLENMFSHTVGSLCILMLFSLAMQKLFIFMRSHLFFFFPLCPLFWDISMKMLLHGMSEIFLPMFSFRTFMVLWLIFKSFIHLEFIFVYSWWCKLVIEFHFFACTCLDLPTPFIEEAIFTPFYVPVPLSNINWLYWHGFISGLSILFHWSLCLFLC